MSSSSQIRWSDHHRTGWSASPWGAFGENRLGPALAKLGIQSEPETSSHPAHEVFLPKAASIAAP